ncbi:hypothetical protein EDD29_5618 [Actinocorallia herbida]|uniref:Uncharacterized protein n=1 Tax=Actinocorallia herbida TaxID=58109 RepID=A0A3N1D374_9ACTN|nr:hypothetical protein [Actinocorallia herbida]ROO87969.1 hypothetical protein EDD29_5618 [Actinocorallia herbida]
MSDHPPPLPEPLLKHLTGLLDDAQAEVDRLTAELEAAHQQLTRLDVTRQTLLDLLPATPTEPDPPQLPPAYQDLLAVLARHPDGLHAREACLALGLPHTHKNTVEGTRAKLKRLVSRDLANEPKPGLFTLKTPKA